MVKIMNRLVFVFLVLMALLIAVTTYNNVKEEEKQGVKVEEVAKQEKKIVKYIKMVATAYTAGVESTGKTPSDEGYGVTASGEIVQEGKTIACPKDMDFGTKVYIKEMNKTFECQDRGSAITSGRLDVYIASLDEALDFGVKEVSVLVEQ